MNPNRTIRLLLGLLIVMAATACRNALSKPSEPSAEAIVLPSTLSGTYTIEVTRGSLTFVGEIEL